MKCQSFPCVAAVFALTLAWALPSLHAADEAALDTATIEAITGLKGVSNQTEGTFKVSKPRDDVSVTVEKTLDKAKVYFMHIGGEGSVPMLAQGVKAIFATEKQIRTKAPAPLDSFGLGELSAKNAIDGSGISQVFGQKGDAKDGMYKVTIGRAVHMAGMQMGNTMGINTWAAFAGTSDDALVVGDFAVLENELQTVLKTLRGANINIVAIHQHMTGEDPRMIFLHYYGRGKALDLARGVKAAINTQPLAANN
jgi:hypothetical protein